MPISEINAINESGQAVLHYPKTVSDAVITADGNLTTSLNKKADKITFDSYQTTVNAHLYDSEIHINTYEHNTLRNISTHLYYKFGQSFDNSDMTTNATIVFFDGETENSFTFYGNFWPAEGSRVELINCSSQPVEITVESSTEGNYTMYQLNKVMSFIFLTPRLELTGLESDCAWALLYER